MKMETLLIGDTESVKYDPCTRINVILGIMLPRIEVKSNITVHAFGKLEAKCWKMISFLGDNPEEDFVKVDEATLMKVWDAFRKLGRKGYDDREEIWDILHEKKLKQMKLMDYFQ